MLLTEKLSGRIKGRTCAFGRKWCSCIKREYYEYLMVSFDDIIIISAIESNEVRDVDTIDMPGVYLHTESYE